MTQGTFARQTSALAGAEDAADWIGASIEHIMQALAASPGPQQPSLAPLVRSLSGGDKVETAAWEQKPVPASGGLGPTLAFGLAAHALVAVISIVVVPVYLRLLGPDGYGLFGFYIVLQSWMILFDMGISPAVARQLSRFRAGALGQGEAVGLLRAAEVLFLGVALAACGVFLASSGWLAGHWLGASKLPPFQVRRALQFAGCLMAARWLAGFYQTALVGLERQVTANTISLIAAVARAGASAAVLMFVSATPAAFFIVQAASTAAEAISYRLMLAGSMPKAPRGSAHHWSLLAGELRFAGALGVSAAISTLIGQTDKLTLSHVLSLAEFGKFSLIMSICTGISLIVPPFAQTFLPRLTGLLAQGRRADFVHVYRLAIALIIVLIASLAGTIAAQPEQVVYAWTGQRDLSQHLAPVLTAYALGTGLSSFLLAPFFLQYASGSVRLQLVGNLLFGAIWVPVLVWGALTHGAIGAGMAWLVGNLLFLSVWTPVVHRRWLSKPERKGLASSSCGLAIGLALALATTRFVDFRHLGRLEAVAALTIVSLSVATIGVLGSRLLRDELITRLDSIRTQLRAPTRP